MLEKTLNRIMQGAKTPEGKIIAIMLTLALGLMTWNATSISNAFADEESDKVAMSDDVSDKTTPDSPETTKPEAQAANSEPDKSKSSEGDSSEEGGSGTSDDSEDVGNSDDSGSSDDSDGTADDQESKSSESADKSEKSDKSNDKDDSGEAADKSSKSSDKKDDDKAKYPKVTLEGSEDGVSVSLEAPEGALPKGVKMKVTSSGYSAEELSDKVEATSGKTVKDINSLRIKLTNKDGKTIQPKKAVSITFEDTGLKGDDFSVYRIEDSEELTLVKPSVPSTSDKQEFKAEAVKAYAIAGLVAADESDAAMPAKEFAGKANGVTVNVVAPDGAFPEGTEMTVKGVSDASVIDAVESAVEGEVKNMAAVDITFRNAEGKEIEPEVPISVTLKSSIVQTAEESVVVHIDDADVATVVADEKATASTMAFESGEFSIYVVVETEVPRLTVKFEKVTADGTTSIETMYVKTSDTVEEIKSILYDPGVGELTDDQVFKGWTTEKNYDKDTTPLLTIADVREDAKNKVGADSFTADDEVTYYAALFTSYKVEYQDQLGVNVGTEAIEFPSYSFNDGEEYEYTVNMEYAPLDPDHQKFLGWAKYSAETSDFIEKDADGKVKTYNNGEKITINGSIILRAYVEEGHWISFIQNGGSYTAPQFVKNGEKSVKPTEDPTRYGYTFEYWCSDEACETKYPFNEELEENIKLYARWKANEKGVVSVLVWKEALPENGQEETGESFELVERIQLEGSTSADKLGDFFTINNGEYPTVTVKGTTALDREPFNETYAYTGFKCARVTASDGTTTTTVTPGETTAVQEVVTPDGKSTINIYFTRAEWELKFYYWRDVSKSNIIANSSGNLNWNTRLDNPTRVNTTSAQPATGVTYGTKVEGDYHYYYIKAKYGANISGVWPSVDWFDSGGKNDLMYWALTSAGDPANPGTVLRVIKGGITTMNEDLFGKQLFGHYGKNNKVYTYNYYVMVEDGVDNIDIHGNLVGETRSHGDEEFYLYDQVMFDTHSGGGTPETPDLDGFTKIESCEVVHSTDTYNFYYQRNELEILYKDGQYFDDKDGRDESVKDNSAIPIREVGGVKFHQNLASYNKGGVNYFDPTEKGVYSGLDSNYYFAGWYKDRMCTIPYTFTTMPSGSITVYAKWIKKQYRVFLHPNSVIVNDDGEVKDESLRYGDENQSTSFLVPSGGQISDGNNIDATRTDYELIGWYTDSDFKNYFNFETFVANDETVTGTYEKTRSTETDKFGQVVPGQESTNTDRNRPWVNNCLDLYAKWRAKLLGANGITVVYDAVEGKGTISGATEYTDPNTYKDKTGAIAQSAATATVEHMTFDHWVVQRWNGDEYVDTNIEVYPGETFTVLKSDAQKLVYQYQDETGQVIVLNDPIPKEPEGTTITVATYTIHLRAEYTPKEQLTPTHIIWFTNDGTGDIYREDGKGSEPYKTLKINEAVDIPSAPTRANYTFKGWYKVNSDKGEGQVPATDTNATANFLVYHPAEGEDGPYYTDIGGNKATEVAADEKNPYDYLYGVWQPRLQIEVMGKTDTKVYNGVKQSVEGFTVKYKVGDGDLTETAPEGVSVQLASGKKAIAEGTNAKTDPGYEMGLEASSFEVAVSSNKYDFDASKDLKVTDGWLKITPADVTVTLHGKTSSLPYDGATHVVEGYEVDSIQIDGKDTTLYTANDFSINTGVEASASRTNVVEDEDGDGQTDMGLTSNSFDNTNNSGNFGTVTFAVADGWLKITPRSVTLTSASDEKVFDGEALTNNTVTVGGDGFANGEGAIYNVTGSQTQVGESDNAFTYMLNEGTSDKNYNITTQFGKLTVTDGPAESLYTLTINYVYENGAQAAAPYTAQLHAGDAYNVASPAIAGYTASDSPVSGNMPARNMTVDVVYSSNTPTPAPTPTPTPTPNQGGGGGAVAPAAAAAPAAPAAAPAAPAAAAAPATNPVNPLVGPAAGTIPVENAGNPPEEAIEDTGTALASGIQGSWSLFDLICTIVAALLAIIMIIFAFGRKRDEEEDENDPNGTNVGYRTLEPSNGEVDDPETAEYKRRRAGRVASLVPGIGSIILLFLTQDFTQPMVIFDQWSILFAILAIVNIVLAIATRTKKDDEEGQQPAGYAPTTA